MKKTRYIALLFASISMSSCNDYLDVVPKGDVKTIESSFEQRTDVYHWLQSCYAMFLDMPAGHNDNPGFLGADELVGGQFAREVKNSEGELELSSLFIGDGLQMASNPYCNIWKKDQAYCIIRYCNIFLEHVNSCYNMQNSEKELWAAEIKALKACVYLELMKRYGPFIICDQNIDPNSSTADMQQPRAPIDDCVNAIVKLCDEAIPVLPHMKQKEQVRWGYFNKEATATIKAYALLYAASPLFNGNTQLKDFVNKNGVRLFPDYDKEKWHKAAVAADEAIEMATEGGKQLYSKTTDKGSTMLNTIHDLQESVLDQNYGNDEVIQAFQVGYGNRQIYMLPYTRSDEPDLYDAYAKGCLAPSMKMVEMFYTNHGLPIDQDKQWLSSKYEMSKEVDNRYKNVVPLNVNILNLHRRREPRFYADIAADGTIWSRASSDGGKQYDNYLIECHQGQSFGTDAKNISSLVPQSLTGYWLKKFIQPDAPFSYYYIDVIGSETYQTIIYRLPELYLMSAEAWNEYLDKPNEHVYDMIDKVRVRAGIPKVRDAWQNYAKNPDKVKTQVGMREIIHREWNIEFAFEGHRYYNLRRWMEAPQELNSPQYGWNILGKTTQSFYNNGEGPIVVWSKRKFNAPRDYFSPIRSEEILVSGCKQNPGW